MVYDKFLIHIMTMLESLDDDYFIRVSFLGDKDLYEFNFFYKPENRIIHKYVIPKYEDISSDTFTIYAILRQEIKYCKDNNIVKVSQFNQEMYDIIESE